MKNLQILLLASFLISHPCFASDRNKTTPTEEVKEKEEAKNSNNGSKVAAAGAIAATGFFMFMRTKPNMEIDGNDGICVGNHNSPKFIAAQEGGITIYDAKTQKEDGTFPFPNINTEGQIFAYEPLAYQSKRNFIAVACQDSVDIFDVEKRKIISKIPVSPKKNITSMAFSYKQAYLAISIEHEGTYFYQRKKCSVQLKFYQKKICTILPA